MNDGGAGLKGTVKHKARFGTIPFINYEAQAVRYKSEAKKSHRYKSEAKESHERSQTSLYGSVRHSQYAIRQVASSF